MESDDCRKDYPVKIPLKQFRVIQKLSAVARVSQRVYLRRMIALLETLASRSEADPVEILESIIGGGKD